MNRILFPQHQYWHFSVPNSKEFNDYINSIDTNFGKPADWSSLCNIKTFYYTDNVEGSRETFTQLLTPSLQLLCEEMGPVSLQFALDNCWLNVYNKHHFQEPHDHWEADLVAVYFLDDTQEDYGDFYFFDTNASTIARYPIWKDIYDYSNSWFPSVKGGDIIFFPPYTYHACTLHKSDTPRRSVAFNLKMRVPE